MKVTEFITAEQIKEVTVPSDFFGFVAVLFDWGVIALALLACTIWPHPLVIAGAMILIGGRQLALAILVHECTHYSLFKTRALNDFIGKWICGAPIWQDLVRYREHHLKHHQFAGSLQDPDYSLVQPFPVIGVSLRRKFLRDLTGITGIKRLYGLLMMDCGYLTYTIAADPKPVSQKEKSWLEIIRSALPKLMPPFIANALLFGFFVALGKPWLFLVWLGSYLTFFSLFLRIRSIAEHACTRMDLDPRLSTRTTLAHWFARATVAPHHVNYHLEHHYLMKAPYFKLPDLHQKLKTSGAYEGAYFAKGYIEVLKKCQN